MHRQEDAEVGIASREVWAVLARERRLPRVGTEISLRRRSVREEQADAITDEIHRRYLVLLFFAAPFAFLPAALLGEVTANCKLQ